MSKALGRRLELRPLAESDGEALFAAIDATREALKRRLRWVGAVASAEDCRGFIRAAAEAEKRGESAVYAVVEAKSKGLVGIAALQRLLENPGLAEASAWIRGDRQEKGYAVEAGRLLIALAFKGDGLHRLYARIDPANRAARKVLQRIGFRYEGCLRHEKRLNGRWVDQECWGLLKGEWKR